MSDNIHINVAQTFEEVTINVEYNVIKVKINQENENELITTISNLYILIERFYDEYTTLNNL
jgi:hypothetical protein